jgi:hypothetical protein
VPEGERATLNYPVFRLKGEKYFMEGFFSSSLGIAALIVGILIVIYFMSSKPTNEELQEAGHEEQVAISSVPSSKEPKAERQNDSELVAAIMGALSAYLDVPASQLVIKSIKRVNGNNSVWRQQDL